MNQNQNKTDDYANLYGNHQQQQPSVYSSPTPVIRQEKKPKQPFSPISLLLVAGVIFLFMGGIIFLTNTWNILPDVLRACCLLSASLIAFGANLLAERVFKLQKTGLAFYILGCIFLPLALGGIGVFSLLGEWFSFQGDGVCLLWAVISMSISGSTFLGQKNYRNTLLVWLSLAGLSGTWLSLDFFLTTQILASLDNIPKITLFGILLVIYAVGASGISERYLRTHDNSYVTKAIPSYLYLVNLFTGFMMIMVACDAEIPACILSLIMAVLFCNYRFIENGFHAGIFGSVLCLMISVYQIQEYFWVADGFDLFCLLFGLPAIILMSLQQMPRLRKELTRTYSYAGIIIASPVILFTGITNTEEHIYFLYALLVIGLVFFFKNKQGKLSEEAKFFVTSACLLLVIAQRTAVHDSNLTTLILVLSALILLAQAVIRKRIWALTTAILTSLAVLLLHVEQAELALLWLCSAGMLAGVIYANKKWRFTLERCCAWGFFAFLAPSVQGTLSLWTENSTAWILTLAVSGVFYLAEIFLFRKALRSNMTKSYLEITSILISAIAYFSYMTDASSKISGFLFCILLLLFSAGLLQKNNNAIAIPQLIILFSVVNHLLAQNSSDIISVISYLILLIAYAVMGRIFLPHGFYQHEDNKIQIDWSLLAGILPIFNISSIIDWYPSILTCLFLAVYSLLYIGRVKNRFIPSVMTSAFSCLTIFFHNVNDPFSVFHLLKETEMKTLQVLLYLFPLHLFILSLLWILPEKYKKSVHTARFCMYCFTMFWLLVISLNFNNAADAILLMIFSFAILAGSFAVKKLRWFTLGFAILFLTTLRLTWKFWTSLHWGIYLFLAGIILIAVASVTEYRNRRPADEPRKKLDFFKTWTW